MKVVIFEPWYTGHHCEYLRRIIRCTKALDVEIVVVFPRSGPASHEYEIHLNDVESLADWRLCPDIKPRGWRATCKAVVSQLRRSVSDERPDHLYVPSAGLISEYSRFATALPTAAPFSEGLHLRGAFGYPSPSVLMRVKSWAMGQLIAKAPWSVFAHLDPWQLQALCHSFPQLRPRALVIPDPVAPPIEISKTNARRELQIPEDASYIGFAGPMTKRKGYDLLLGSFERVINRLPANAKLLLAGPFTPQGRNLISTQYCTLLRNERLVIVDRHLTAREMDLVIPALDIVSIPYRNHSGSSGIALRAAAASRPILAPDRYWLRNIVKVFALGTTCNVHDPVLLANGITESFRHFETYKRNAAADRFLRFHSEENFAATWSSHLRARLALAPSPDVVSWDWVLGTVAHNPLRDP